MSLLLSSTLPAYTLPPGAIDRPGTVPTIAPALAEHSARFWARVHVDGPLTDPCTCWCYDGQPSRIAEGKPPFFTIRFDTIPVARVAYELTGHGSTAQITLRAACGHCACCRPRHMLRRDYGRATRYGRGVADMAAGHHAAIAQHERFAEPPFSRCSLASQHLTADPAALVTSIHALSAEPLAENALAAAHAAVGLTVETFDALLTAAGVTVWRNKLGDTTHVFTPWGHRHYEHEDHRTAMLLSLIDAPDAIRLQVVTAAA